MKKRQQKINLHERLKKHSYDHALITTFTFGTRFFEDYALENFRSLQENGNVSVLVDDREYRDLLKAAMTDAESFPKLANLRYLLHPIRVRGVFHPKVFLFANKRRGLLIIGSANFTSDGLGSNAELVATYEFEADKNEVSLALFQSALHFFEDLSERWPAEQLRSNLDTLVAEVPWLSNEAPIDPASELPVLLHNLEVPLWDQLVKRMPGPVSELSVVSRFYDANPGLVDHVRSTAQIDRVKLYTQNGITTMTEAWLESPLFKSGAMEVQLCRYADEEHTQQLHGKAYTFTSGDEVMLAMGSANFTTSALRRTAANGNMEVLLCYPPVPKRELSPKLLFDPNDTAVRLRTVDQLVSATDNPDESTEESSNHPVRILEAVVDEGWLRLTVSGWSETISSSCRILQGNQRPIILAVSVDGTDRLSCRLDEIILKRLRARPSLVGLGVSSEGKWNPRSEVVLLTNLQDIRTGRDIRRERQIREARESPQKFLDLLAMLAASGDEERLKQFLTYCDIPIDLPVRLIRRNPPRKGNQAPKGEIFRVSGDRQLRQFQLLHEAVMDFSKRHYRRLNQHVDRGTSKGIPNFLHILLTICNLLLSQIERLVAAIEADGGREISADQWRHIRDQVHDYYQELGKLVEITAVNYLDALFESETEADVRNSFGEGLEDLNELLNRAIRTRDDLVGLRESHVSVKKADGGTIVPEFFSCIIAPAKWPAFAKRLMNLQNQLNKRLAV